MTNRPYEILDKLRQLYALRGIAFREVEHAATFTSEESARARGEPLRIGGKALLLKCQWKHVEEADRVGDPSTPDIRNSDGFVLVVLPADAQLSSPLVRDSLKLKKFRFATADELLQKTGLVPGSVPPFGEPILPFPLVIDELLTRNDRIAFNAGSLKTSHVLAMQDYLTLVNPVFAKVCECDRPA